MNDLLRDFLVRTTTPEQFDTLVRAHAVFEQFQLDNYQDPFESAMMTLDTRDYSSTVDLVVQLTDEMLDTVLELHGIRYIDSASLLVKIITCEGIALVESFEDTDTVYNICTDDDDDISRFATLMELMTGYQAELFLPDLDFVSELLFNRIREVLQEQQDRRVEEVESALYARRNLVARWIQFIEAPAIRALELIRSDLVFGEPLETYLGIIGRDFEGMSVKDAALNFITFALMSSDYYQSPSEGSKQYLERYVSELNQVTAIQRGITQLLAGFANYAKS